MLIRSAFSANIKERRDCSTALFDEQGRMIVQAEHIPVHLGAMPEAVAAVLARDPQPGEVYVVNDPFTGGTHLPDITLVSRVPCGLACSRAHHADVGGMEPASLPAGSTDIYQEGLVLPPVRLDDELLTVLLANMRNPDERRGDLNAQLAAHRLAERRLAELVERRGADTVTAAMDELYDYSERVVRAGIAGSPTARTRPVTPSSRSEARSRSRSPSRSPATRSRSISREPRLSTRATSTARSPSPALPATSSSAASPSRISRRPAAPTRRSTSRPPPARS